MISSKRPIGVFDSGIGGLTVLKSLQSVLPHEHFIYFADTAHLPYGEKTADQIIDYGRRTLAWMRDEIGAKLVIAACHTSSATALEVLEKDFDLPLIGAIHPMIETILQNPIYRRIGIIATPASVKSRVHETLLRKAGFQGEIVSVSCPAFVPLIEAGHFCGPQLEEAVRQSLKAFPSQNLDTLIYGCTHYPWIAPTIRKMLPPSVQTIDPAASIALKASQTLYKQKIVNPSGKNGKVDFYCSGSPEIFASQVTRLMAIPLPQVTVKKLDDPSPLPRQWVVNQ